MFYNTPVEIELISEEETLDMTHVVLKLHFDNIGELVQFTGQITRGVLKGVSTALCIFNKETAVINLYS